MLTPPAAGPGPGSAFGRLLARQPPTDIQWGLERIAAMLDVLGNPHRAWPSVHVGGTNGKGSVAATAASILETSKRRTGLYTSPHLVHFRERIVIDGRPASLELLESCAERVLPLADQTDCSFFESTTALAFLAFAEAGVEAAVVEVGLGGRLDATNVLDPSVSVVTNIAHDHSEHLGHSLQLIAAEKAGIVKPRVPLVLGPIPERLVGTFRSAAAALDAPAFVLGLDGATESIEAAGGGTSFTYRSSAFPAGLELWTPLFGSHQATNASLAMLALECSAFGAPGAETARTGIASVSWPGRFQVVESDGTWVIDMAHNTAAAELLAHTLAESEVPRPIVPVIAILGDKPWLEMLEPLLRLASAAVFTVAPSSPPIRRWNPMSSARAVRGHRPEVIPDFGAALTRARILAGEGTVVVTGSAHTAGDALLALKLAAHMDT